MYIFLAVSLLANFLLGYQAIRNQTPTNTTSHNITTEQLEQLPYLSKRLAIESPNEIIINFIPLRTSLREYIKQSNIHVGVYFEYLPSGVSIGINDTEEFIQASLIKLPVAMAIFKHIEQGKMNLDDTLVLKPEHIDSYFGDLYKRGAGGTVTVQEALEAMLTQSDNTAVFVLNAQLPEEAMGDVFSYLDIPLNVDPDNKRPLVTAKNYSSILRSLYLSSYLTPEHSNLILELLTKSPFNEKIAGGIPLHIPISHKMGAYSVNDNKTTFSDCGIIYYPKKPYMLCVMAHDDEDDANKHISTISKMIYTYISQTAPYQ